MIDRSSGLTANLRIAALASIAATRSSAASSDRLRATKILEERALANKKIEFIWESVADGISGGDKARAVRLKNVKTGEKKEISADGVFIFIGYG